MSKLKINIILLTFAMLLLVCGGLYSLAYFNQTTDSVTNQFLGSTFDLEVKEKFETWDAVKEDVCVQNTGNVPMYMRVKFIVQAQDESGTIIANPIVVNELNSRGIDIDDFEISKIENWFKLDGYYYYPDLVNPDEEVLFFERASLKEDIAFKGDYTPILIISAQGVQYNAIEMDMVWREVQINENNKLIPSV